MANWGPNWKIVVGDDGKQYYQADFVAIAAPRSEGTGMPTYGGVPIVVDPAVPAGAPYLMDTTMFASPAGRAAERIAALQKALNVLLWRPDSAPVASSDPVSRLPVAPPPIPGRFQNLDFEEMP